MGRSSVWCGARVQPARSAVGLRLERKDEGEVRRVSNVVRIIRVR